MDYNMVLKWVWPRHVQSLSSNNDKLTWKYSRDRKPLLTENDAEWFYEWARWEVILQCRQYRQVHYRRVLSSGAMWLSPVNRPQPIWSPPNRRTTSTNVCKSSRPQLLNCSVSQPPPLYLSVVRFSDFLDFDHWLDWKLRISENWGILVTEDKLERSLKGQIDALSIM